MCCLGGEEKKVLTHLRPPSGPHRLTDFSHRLTRRRWPQASGNQFEAAAAAGAPPAHRGGATSGAQEQEPGAQQKGHLSGASIEEAWWNRSENERKRQ